MGYPLKLNFLYQVILISYLESKKLQVHFVLKDLVRISIGETQVNAQINDFQNPEKSKSDRFLVKILISRN